MKRILLFTLAILPLIAACDKDKPEEEEKVTIKLDVTNLTDDGYFDGLLYYKVTSNSPCEVSVNKVENTATMVEIPSRIEINGNIYSCTSIADNAFYRCGTLSSITIPNTIRSIGDCSFEGCDDLKNVIMSESIKSISSRAFYGCRDLTTITIPKGVTSIMDYAFCNCNKLTTITIPETVTGVGENAFSGTPWYSNQPNGLVYVGKAAYKYKGEMLETSIVISDGTRSISSYAFDGCYQLASVTIPESVTTIGLMAFSECSLLSSIRCRATTPPIKFTTSFSDYSYENCILYIPKGSLSSYKETGWNDFQRIVEEK